MHTVLITLHAVSATIALLAGLAAITGGTLFGVYLWSLVGMEVFLLAAIASEWTLNGTATRVIFLALAALGAVMVVRAALARRVRDTPAYIDHVGFTLVGLVDAFAVVFVLNLGAPGWLVAATGVLIAVAGHFAVRGYAAGRPPRAESGPIGSS